MAGRRIAARVIFESLESPTVPLPPPALQVEVLGRETTLPDFLYGGYMVARGVQDALRLAGRPLETFASVLDFGCGCGRVLRWFQDLAPAARLHGADVSARAVEWNRVHMPFARFDGNGPEPPLPHPPESFDLVLAISVVTHLAEELHLRWLAELRRVLRPGGVALVSVHGDDVSLRRLRGRDRAAYERTGHFYKKVRWWRGLHGLPAFYQDAFHSRAYVERVWTRELALRAYVRHGPLFSQDLVVLEKHPHPGPGAYALVDLPFASVGGPGPGALVEGAELPTFGTAFFPDGRPATVEVRVDGRSLGRLAADAASPKVGRAFRPWASANRSTFAGRLPLGAIAPGGHRLDVYANGEDRVAAASSYFFTR